jgi:pimeloyl-ACP methyl ester carboxylesterase
MLMKHGIRTTVRKRPGAMRKLMSDYSTTEYQALPAARRDEVVFVLHGFGGSRLMTAVLCNRLARCGFDVCNWGYPSLRQGIQRHAVKLRNELTLAQRHACRRPIHVVAYSMGAVVARCAFLEMDLAVWKGRVVMLGPPNYGSPVARICGPIVGRWSAPVRELSDRDGSFVRNLPDGPLPPTGIIAARFDHLIPVDNTRLMAISDHRIVNTIHKGLVFDREVSRLTAQFLESGSFSATAGEHLDGAATHESSTGSGAG